MMYTLRKVSPLMISIALAIIAFTLSSTLLVPSAYADPEAPGRDDITKEAIIKNGTVVENGTVPPLCTAQKRNEVLAPANEFVNTVEIDCDLTLSSRDIVTKRMIFIGEEATGVTVNCNGATLNSIVNPFSGGRDMIWIKSRKDGDGIWDWVRPENITVKNCNIIGSIRVSSIKGFHKRSSRNPEHVRMARMNAPTKIVFDNVTIIGVGSIPLYYEVGVTYTDLINSEIKGVSNSVAIYLDAETYGNTIKNNRIYADTGREIIAIDSSSHNRIINNWFSGLDNGGIYLYRNCGELGTIRHTTPSHNTIVNNIFYYNKYRGPKPSIYLGSRDGDHWGCDDDRGYPYGSSVSDKDYARYNVIAQNQIYKRSIGDMIKTNNTAINSPNYIDYNQTVTAETVVNERPAGCYVGGEVPRGYKQFILHRESIDVFKNSFGEPISNGQKGTCDNGVLIRSIIPRFQIDMINFDCQVSGSNNGCQKSVSVPPGKKIVGVAAACNLEFGTISNSTLATVPFNTIMIVRESDSVSSGFCFVGTTGSRSEEVAIDRIVGLERLTIGCKEHDKNGGDCHIKGILYYR